MFYYVSVIAFMLIPMNIPVEEKSVIGPFPEKYQCEIYKAHMSNLIDNTSNAEIKTAKCITQVQS